MGEPLKPLIGIFADDLTGALDAAAPFADRGFRTLVSPSPDLPIGANSAEVLSINLGTRHKSPDEIADVTRTVVEMFVGLDVKLLLNKIDSTLRGNPAVELVHAMTVTEADHAILCPAYPQNGRTVSSGVLLVDNVPVSYTDIGRDQLSPQPEMLMSEARGWDTAYQVVLQNRVARPEDSDLVASVIDAAADAGLVLTETGTTLDGVATIENESYTATPVLISTIGTLESIETYLQMLETSRFASFGIEAATVEEGLVGYQLTLRGLFYSLPEDFGDDGEVVDSSPDVTPVVPVDMQVVNENGGAK